MERTRILIEIMLDASKNIRFREIDNALAMLFFKQLLLVAIGKRLHQHVIKGGNLLTVSFSPVLQISRGGYLTFNQHVPWTTEPFG